MNRKQQVVAYELIHQASSTEGAVPGDARQDTARLILSAIFDVGLRQLVADGPAHIRIPASLLPVVTDFPLDPARSVITVTDGAVLADEQLCSLCCLRDAGYRVVVESSGGKIEQAALLACADFIQFDLRRFGALELVELVQGLRATKARLMAANVDTPKDFEFCRELGFELFQGTFLQMPEAIKARRLSGPRLTALQIMERLADPARSAEELEQCIVRDVGFSYRILKSINSSYYQMPRQIASIRQAVVLLGLNQLQKFCWLVLLAELEDAPDILCVQALTRARMCELLCVAAGQNGSESYFMTGMISLLDALLRIPMEEALPSLSLSCPVISALLWHEGPMGAALTCTTSYERGEWCEARFASLTSEQVAAAYLQATAWADEAWRLQRSA